MLRNDKNNEPGCMHACICNFAIKRTSGGEKRGCIHDTCMCNLWEVFIVPAIPTHTHCAMSAWALFWSFPVRPSILPVQVLSTSPLCNFVWWVAGAVITNKCIIILVCDSQHQQHHNLWVRTERSRRGTHIMEHSWVLTIMKYNKTSRCKCGHVTVRKKKEYDRRRMEFDRIRCILI
jgi:hypothetical protein